MNTLFTRMALFTFCCSTIYFTIMIVCFLDKCKLNSSHCLGSSCLHSEKANDVIPQYHRNHVGNRNKSFIFHAGFKSTGGVIYNLSLVNTIEELEELCLSDKRCVGFNCDGLLKDRLLPFEKWIPLNTKQKGLYVINSDYCANHEGVCPLNSICVSMIGGKYSCKQNEEMLNTSNKSLLAVIHVVIAVDKGIFPAVLPFLLSLTNHTKRNIIIHVVIGREDERKLQNLISCGFPIPNNIQIDVVELDLPDTMKELIYIRKNATRYLSSLGNFVRFNFDQLFPSLNYILYLDVDTIVKHDIGALWKEVVFTEKLLVVVPKSKGCIGDDLNSSVSTPYHKRYGEYINMTSPAFNAGVIGFNLYKWRKNNKTAEVIYWMSENKKKPLWQLGTQPILYVVAYGDWKFVDGRWNVDGLAKGGGVSGRRISQAYILHWNGLGKPWLKKNSNPTPKYVKLWKPYDKGLCNRRGMCCQSEQRIFCKCEKGFKGSFCETKIV